MEKKLVKFINNILSKFGICIQKITKNEQLKNAYYKKIKEKKNDIHNAEVQDFISQNQWLRSAGIKTILDIGANEGQFAEKINLILPEAKKICFEPLKDPFEKLKNKFENDNNFSFFHLALGNMDGEQKIFRNEYSPSSSILPMKLTHKEAFDFARCEFEEVIEIRKLDNLAESIFIDKPYLVKMDVQGFESEVIKGGIKTVGQAEIIILETSFIQLYEGAPLFDDIYLVLKDMGFSYVGSFEQLRRPRDGKILQQDSLFINSKSKLLG
jgi:FkbM family methyltransferase